jgi:Rap1a immunity proteins
MRVCLCVLVAFCASALATDGHQVKEGRTYPAPRCYVKAGKFVELSELERVIYISGLADGFYGSAMFGASEKTVERLNSCTKDMDSKQVAAIVSKYVTDHPETWHLPLSVEAYNAFNAACPGGLSVHSRK